MPSKDSRSSIALTKQKYRIQPFLALEHYMVTGVPSEWINSSKTWSSCSVISEALVPLSEPFEWDYLNGFELEWYVPNCRFCEAVPGKVCGFDNNTRSKLRCSNAINSTNGTLMSNIVTYTSYVIDYVVIILDHNNVTIARACSG